MSGINLDVPPGAALAGRMIEKYASDIGRLLSGRANYVSSNQGFHPLDAALLYASIREAKPARIVEIGSGMSTFVIAAALRDDSLQGTSFTCIQPGARVAEIEGSEVYPNSLWMRRT